MADSPPSQPPGIYRAILSSLDFLLFSNLFIGVCAVAQALVTYKLIDAKPDNYVLGLLFFATVAEYNLSILLSKPKHPERSQFRRTRWFFAHHQWIISMTIISVLSILVLGFFLSMPSQLLLVFLGVTSVAYSVPFFTVGERRFGLRNIPGIKLFLIAMVWSLSCVLLPILELESHHITLVSAQDTMLLVAKRFLLVAAITVPFDIRDLFHDKMNELKTIPVLLGERKAYYFCLLLLVGYLVLLFLFNPAIDVNFAALFSTVVISAWLIFKSDQQRDEYYYFFFLDGILILQYVLLAAVSL